MVPSENLTPNPGPTQQRGAWWSVGWAAVVLLIGGMVLWYFTGVMGQQFAEQERVRFGKRLEGVGLSLASVVNRQQALLAGLASFVKMKTSDEALRRDFATYAEGLYSNDQVIRAIQFFPTEGSVLVYPVEKNTSILDRTLENLLTDERPAVRDDVKRAIQSRKIALSDPYELRQGGKGVVSRFAVFDQEDKLLGLAVVILNIEPLLAQSGIIRASAEQSIALRDSSKSVFFGDRRVFEKDPVVYVLPLPEGSWELGAIPRNGWGIGQVSYVFVIRILGFVVVVFAAIFTHIGLRRHSILSGAIDWHTRVLKESEEKYRLLFREALSARHGAETAREQVTHILERISDGFASLDREWRYTFVNAKLAQTLGRRREDMVGRCIWKLFPDLMGTQLHSAYLKALSEQHPIVMEYFYSTYGRWYEHRFYPSHEGLSVFCRDITDRRRAELAAKESQAETNRLLCETQQSRQALLSVVEDQREAQAALKASEERYRNLVETSFDWVWEVDDRFCYTYSSPRVKDLLGYEAGEILGKYTYDLMPKEEAARVRMLISEHIKGKKPFSGFENINSHKDGRLIVLETNANPIFDAKGVWRGYRGIDRDITERRAAERALRLQSAALEAAANAVLITDRRGLIEWANPAFSTLSGWSIIEAIGKNPRELVKSDQHPKAFYKLMWDTILAGRIWRGEIVNRRKDGALRTEDMTITPLRGQSGEITHFIAIKQDITERKTMQAKFLHGQRMEAIGTLAGGIAHDLNNILAPVLMASGIIRNKLRDEADREMVAMMEASARRGADIVKQLLTFSRGQEGQHIAVQPRHLIKEMLRMMRETFPRDIELQQKTPATLWTVIADPTQLHQVLLNLCVNARDAMDRGGRLTIEAGNIVFSDGDVSLPFANKPGPYVYIFVSDTGHGITTDVKSRIFDPFFTTKTLGKGTGLGLSTVLGIVTSHGGFVTVDSTLGKGSTFRVYLPAVLDQSADDVVEVIPMPVQMDVGKTILVVDDERSVRDATRMLLENVNYRVVTASNGAEALAQYLERRQEINLVLTDLMMPVMNGIALVRALRAIDADLKIIATSGLEDEIKRKELDLLGVKMILSKPCEGTVLCDAIHKSLNSET